ncbi:hypothetical protein CG747_24470 [Streptomyces sp. CB02959]|nr:hypothetical protein CG747_24470 [Streptomyces sp. CB02959]
MDYVRGERPTVCQAVGQLHIEGYTVYFLYLRLEQFPNELIRVGAQSFPILLVQVESKNFDLTSFGLALTIYIRHGSYSRCEGFSYQLATSEGFGKLINLVASTRVVRRLW